jgi:OOP family OmpA-OmpF porin
MRNLGLSALAFGLTLSVSAGVAGAGAIFDTSSGLGLEADGIPFQQGLYQGYSDLSASRDDAWDPVDAELFNHKARRAARRSSVLPDQVSDRELNDDDRAEIGSAYTVMHTAFTKGGREIAPLDAAQAQVSYDCWIEAAEGSRDEDADACKAAFLAAMARLDEALAGPQVAAAPEEDAIAEPAQIYVLYFDFDSAGVSSASAAAIARSVEVAKQLGVTEFSVTGHADRSGPEDYNQNLSLERANAVKNQLISLGIDPDSISVAGRGESEPAVETEDGVREPANRRVEIVYL